MKKKLKNLLVLAIAGTFIFVTVSAFSLFQKTPWNVPDAAKNKRNPVASNAESIAAGKALWGTHCKSCHGAKGKGDGPKAAQLKTEPGDFTLPATQSQTDGSLFYKTSEGRDDMPKFKAKIPDEDDRWSLVNFIRTLKQ